MPYFVYIIECKDGSYYTGQTGNLKKRITRHKKGKAARYTKIHGLERVVYTKKFKTREEALKEEKRIKRLSHKEKAEMGEIFGKI